MNDITKALIKRLEEKLNYKEELVLITSMGSLFTLDGNPIIGAQGEVNFRGWHSETLKHKYFKFDSISSVFIETEEQVQEFEQTVLRYFLIDKTDVPEVVKETAKTTGTKLKVERSNINGTYLNVRKDDEINKLSFQSGSKTVTVDLIKINEYTKEELEQFINDLYAVKFEKSEPLNILINAITMLQNELILRKLGEL